MVALGREVVSNERGTPVSGSGLWPDSCLQPCQGRRVLHPYLTESVCTVVLQKSIPAQISQPILCYYYYEGYVDGFVWEFTFAIRLYKHFP